MSAKQITALAAGALAVIIGLTVAFGSIVVVHGGYVGVKKRMGSIYTEELHPGLNFKWPMIESVTQLSTRLKGFKLSTSSQSKDLQRIDTEITVQHSLNASMAAEALQNVGDLDKIDVAVVQPAIQESLKAVTARFTAEELIQHRDEVKDLIGQQIRKFIEDTLDEKGLSGAVVVHNVAVTDFDFSPEFSKSIEQKVLAEQQALQAVNEQKKRTTEAEAEYVEKTKAAEAAAYEVEVISKANAAAIKREAEALKANPELLQLRAIEAWKKGGGKLPTYVGGSQQTPFISGHK